MTTYGSGKYDLQSMNDGRTVVRWKDKNLGIHFQAVIDNFDHIMDQAVGYKLTQHHFNIAVEAMKLLCRDLIEFSNKNVQVCQAMTSPSGFDHDFVSHIEDFVLAYNKVYMVELVLAEIVLAVADMEEIWNSNFKKSDPSPSA